MKWPEWEPLYEEILRDFGYPRERDEAARDLLAELLLDHPGLVEPDALAARLRGREAHVYGAALGPPDLPAPPEGAAVVVADKGIARAMRSRLFPDVVVTDLDGDIALQVEANRRGSLVVVHAHGDNMDALRRYLPRFPGPVLGTCQCEPVGLVHDWGGFTDGDRACHLAAEMGATAVHLEAFDFQQVGAASRDPAVKARKLQWAARLVALVPVPVYWRGAPFTHASTQA